MKKLLLIMMMALALVYTASAAVTSNQVSPSNGNWTNAFPMQFQYYCGANSSTEVGFNTTLFHNVGSNIIRSNYTSVNLNADTTYNFTQVAALPENNSGYSWTVQCVNNLTGERANFSSIASFKVDTTAPTVPVISVPVNGSSNLNTTPNVVWSQTTETNFLRYRVQFMNSTDLDTPDILFEKLVTSVSTLSVIMDSVTDNMFYFVRVLAQDEAGNSAWQFVNFSVVTSAPSITVSNFSDGTITSDTTPNFGITVTPSSTPTLIDRCDSYINGTTNVTVRRSGGDLSFTTGLSDGLYNFNFRCNTTAGQATVTSNRSIRIDATAPTAFACLTPVNNSKNTDWTPTVSWNTSLDDTIVTYRVLVDESSDFTSADVDAQTNSTSYTANLLSLNSTDRTFYIKVNASDQAGNTRDSLNCSIGNNFIYKTDNTNFFLKAGWNMVSLMRTGTVNASTIASEIPNAAVISKYNSSKNFQNYNNGTSTNAGLLFRKGEVAFIYVNQDSLWEGETWDTDVNPPHGGLFNLTNTSSGWNVIGIVNQSGTTIGIFEQLFRQQNDYSTAANLYYSKTYSQYQNYSLTFVTFYNNTAARNRQFVSHPYDINLNNATNLDYGNAIWVNVNETTNQSVITLNWSVVVN